MIPPAVVRRPLIGPLWVALAVLGALLSPVLLPLAALASLFTRHRQPLLLWRFGLTYLVYEALVIVACGGLWVLSGFGLWLRRRRFQLWHYRLLGWLLGGILAEVLTTLRLEIEAEPSQAAGRALSEHRKPLILLSRHAGPGDSFLLVYLLLTRYGRLPRIVMKRGLALDPCIDVLCHRLPNALIDTRDGDLCRAQIGELAAGLDRRGVLVLFPEGGNFSAERRQRAITRLWRQGRGRQAAQAERMEHVMAPKPAGALAALASNPEADVIFAAHTGLGRQAFASELFRAPPTDRRLDMRMWLAPAAERPNTEDEQIEWLFDWWKTLDDWIDAQGTESTARAGG